MGLGRLGSRGEMVPRSENSLSHHWQLGDQRQGLGGQKGAREPLRCWVSVPPGSSAGGQRGRLALAH